LAGLFPGRYPPHAIGNQPTVSGGTVGSARAAGMAARRVLVKAFRRLRHWPAGTDGSKRKSGRSLAECGRCSCPGHLVIVSISARLGARVMVATVFLAQALGIGQLPLLGQIGTRLLFILVQGRGQRHGDAGPRQSLAEIFGGRHYGAIAGAVALGANGAGADRAGRCLAPVGRTRLLPAVFWVLAASLVLAALAVLIAQRVGEERRGAAVARHDVTAAGPDGSNQWSIRCRGLETRQLAPRRVGFRDRRWLGTKPAKPMVNPPARNTGGPRTPP
jgi:hypothetical protein